MKGLRKQKGTNNSKASSGFTKKARTEKEGSRPSNSYSEGFFPCVYLEEKKERRAHTRPEGDCASEHEEMWVGK